MVAFYKKVAIVTGSSSGIGRATALLFARGGGITVLHGKSKERMAKTLDLFKKEKIPEKRILSILGPIEEEEVQKRLIEESVDKFGRLDILVNNAGVNSKPGLSSLDLENVDYSFNINARSVLSLTKMAIPHLETTKGAVVNISSVLTTITSPYQLQYQMAKAALEQQTRNFAVTYAADGIRFNTVCPGLVPTNIGSAVGIEETAFENVLGDFIKKSIPMRRMGTPMEIANVIAFLASDLASYVTGSTYVVDGGLLLGHPFKFDPPNPDHKKTKHH